MAARFKRGDRPKLGTRYDTSVKTGLTIESEQHLICIGRVVGGNSQAPANAQRVDDQPKS